jgi:uncharacterized glyoxalase superfamily protein PhnB
MKVTASTVFLNVADVLASAAFAQDHLGFAESSFAGYPPSASLASVTHPGTGFNVIFLDANSASFEPAAIAGPAGRGTLLALTVENVDHEAERLAKAGVALTTEPHTEPWGERYCQLTDPNGLVWQLIQWV